MAERLADQMRRAAGRRVNWALPLGLGLVLGVAALAWLGPGVAPHDPLQEHYILQNPLTDRFLRPPVPALTIPGYPLGTDQFGRDILSQLLWAVRPTLTLVAAVAALRLVLGLFIGVASGWWETRAGRALDGLISAALAAPVIFVALAVLAAANIRWGVWAFVLGLSATGWAEVARLLREQTRYIKHLPYLEAARALGATDGQLVVRHVLPHLLPLVWILLALEISATLLTTASLGFLGYFTNAVWIPLEDFSMLRASGLPELGQMLGLAAQNPQRQPWGLAAAASLIFLMVLGFNLLGDGLRQRLSPEQRRRRETRLGLALERAGGYVEDRWFDPLSPWRRNLGLGLAATALLALLLIGAYSLLRAQAARLAQSAVRVPGDHLWASELHDAQGTLWTEADGPPRAELAWSLDFQPGLTGGPVVAADGTLYVNATDGKLHAVGPNGRLRWTADLPEPPFGTPALASDGDIYVLGMKGTLADFTPAGALRWTVQPEPGRAPLSSPMVDAANSVYFSTERSLVAVTLDGQVRWRAPLPTFSYASATPRLSVDGAYLLFEDVLLDAASGATIFGETRESMDKYVVGTDGELYLRRQAELLRFTPTEAGAEIRPHAAWDIRALNLGPRFPSQIGLTPDGRIWVFYGTSFEFAKVQWLTPRGEYLASLDFTWRGAGTATLGRVIGIDRGALTYVCGPDDSAQQAGATCRAYRPEPGPPLWEVSLENSGPVAGGAVAPGRVYVTTTAGRLYAIGGGN